MVDFDKIAGTEEVSEALAVAEEATAIATARQYSNSVDFDQTEISWPKLRLAQALTPEVNSGEAKAGQWILIGEQPVEAAVVVPTALARIRQYRGDDRSMLCQSPDAIHGVGEFGAGSAKNPTGLCASCPMSQWQPNPRDPKKSLPAPCTLIYSYICYSITHNQVAVVEFSRSAMNAAKFLNTLIQTRGFGKFAVQLGSQSNKSPRGGTYYTPTVQFHRATEEQLEAAAAFAVAS